MPRGGRLPSGSSEGLPILRGVGAYSAASIIRRSLGLLLLPVYARVLEPAEYGQVAIIATVTAAAGIVLGLGLEISIFRTIVQLKGSAQDRWRFLNVVGGFGLVVPPLLACVLAVPVAAIAGRAFAIPDAATALGLIGAGFSASTASVQLAVLRAEERLRDYVTLSLFQAVVSAALTLLFVVVFRWGVVGFMLASALAAALAFVIGIPLLKHKWSREWDLGALRSALSFGLPMVPHAVSHWGLALSDRVILGALLPASQVGVYYMAYQFSLPIGILSVAIAQSVQPIFAAAAVSDANRSLLGRVATFQAIAVAYLTMTVVVLGPPAVRLLLPPAYSEATSFIPWIALGTGLFGLYFIPMNAVTLLAGENRWVWPVTLTAASANVLLNLVLVPTIGAMAAAIDTAIGYGLLLAGVSMYARKLDMGSIGIDFRRLVMTVVLLAMACVFVAVVAPEDPAPLPVIIRLSVVILAGALLLVSASSTSVRTIRRVLGRTVLRP